MKASLFTKCSPHRIYLSQIGSKSYLQLSQGKLKIQSDDKSLVPLIKSHLELHGIDQSDILNNNDILSFVKSIPEMDGGRASKPSYGKFDNLVNDKGIRELSLETSQQKLETIKFKASTIKNGYVIVDHREPLALQTMMFNCQIDSVDVAQLPFGDVLIGNKDGDCELIIERKTIKDANFGITDENHHAHDQIERYYQYIQEKAEVGVHVKVIWIFENEEERTLYNALNAPRQMDGWLNLSIAISDQYVANTYNLVHTGYLITKFAQGFLERTLTNAIRVGGKRIDKPKPHKLRKNIAIDKTDRGISRAEASIAATLSLMPNIPSNVAKEMANTGRSINQITSMSYEEIKALKGVGDKRAKEIYSTFNDEY